MAGLPLLIYVQAWALAFALTQLVEVPIYRAVARVTWRRAFSLSLVTHPVVWFGFPLLYDHDLVSWSQMMWLAEIFAYAVEAALLRGYGLSWRRAILASILANTASIVAGELARSCGLLI